MAEISIKILIDRWFHYTVDVEFNAKIDDISNSI